MNVSPITVRKDWTDNQITSFLKTEDIRRQLPKYGVRRIPVLDDDKHVVNIIFASEKGFEWFDTFYPEALKDRPIKTILIVGGAGYLGSVLCRKLLDKGYIVKVLDNLTYGDHGIRNLYDQPNFIFIHGDIRDIQIISNALKDVDAVIHLAAIVGDSASTLDSQQTIEINYLATKMLAEACKDHHINRFLFASTCSVYGANQTPDNLITEKSLLNPLSLYSQMKLKSEQATLELINKDFSPVILRLATLYGLSPRMRFDLVVNRLTAKAVQENRITIFGGKQWRPNIHVQDAAEIFIKCLESPLDSVGGKIFNVGINEQNYQIKQIGKMIHNLLPKAEILTDEEHIDRRNYNVSFTKIQQVIQYTPRYSIEDAIREIKDAFHSGVIQDYTNKKYSNYEFLNHIKENSESKTMEDMIKY